MDNTDRTPLFGDQQQTQPKSADSAPLYHNQSSSPANRLLQFAFVIAVILMVLITLVLTIYKTATMHDGGLYFMLGVSLMGFVSLEGFMISFIRKGELAAEKSWFLYVVGACVILEAIFTDVLLFQ